MPLVTSILSTSFLFWATYKRVKALIIAITPWLPFAVDCSWFVLPLLQSMEYLLALWENAFVFDGMLKIIDFKREPVNKFVPKRPAVPNQPKKNDEDNDKSRDKDKKDKKNWRDNLQQFYKDHKTAIYVTLGLVVVGAVLLYAYHNGWFPPGGDDSDSDSELNEKDLKERRKRVTQERLEAVRRQCYDETVALEQLANAPGMRNFWLAVAGAATLLPVWNKPVDWVWYALKQVFGVQGDSIQAGSLYMVKHILTNPKQAGNTAAANYWVKATPAPGELEAPPWTGDPNSVNAPPNWRRSLFLYTNHIATSWLSEATGIPVADILQLNREQFGAAVEAAYTNFYQNPQVKEAVLHLIQLLDKAYYKCHYPK